MVCAQQFDYAYQWHLQDYIRFGNYIAFNSKYVVNVKYCKNRICKNRIYISKIHGTIYNICVSQDKVKFI